MDSSRSSHPSEIRVPGRRGFSLVELLAVLVLIAFIALLFGLPFLDTLKRSRLETTASGVQTIVQRAVTEMQRRNVMTFLIIRAAAPDGSKTLDIVADTNPAPSGNGVFDDGAGLDTVVQSYRIPPEISLSTAATNQYETLLWSDNATTNANQRWLGVDFLGRTVNPTTGLQNTSVALLQLTHNDMISGRLKGITKFELRINPVWNASLQKYFFDRATSTWKKV